MATVTVYRCDHCGQEFPAKKPPGFTTFTSFDKKTISIDLCEGCQRNAVLRLVCGKEVVFRPFCKTCAGKGKVEEPDNSSGFSDNRERKFKKCPMCQW